MPRLTPAVVALLLAPVLVIAGCSVTSTALPATSARGGVAPSYPHNDTSTGVTKPRTGPGPALVYGIGLLISVRGGETVNRGCTPFLRVAQVHPDPPQLAGCAPTEQPTVTVELSSLGSGACPRRLRTVIAGREACIRWRAHGSVGASRPVAPDAEQTIVVRAARMADARRLFGRLRAAPAWWQGCAVREPTPTAAADGIIARPAAVNACVYDTRNGIGILLGRTDFAGRRLGQLTDLLGRAGRRPPDGHSCPAGAGGIDVILQLHGRDGRRGTLRASYGSCAAGVQLGDERSGRYLDGDLAAGFTSLVQYW